MLLLIINVILETQRDKTRCRLCRKKSSELQGLLLPRLCTLLCLAPSPSPPSLFPFSCFFLNGCFHGCLSFLLYLNPTAFHRGWGAEQTEECGGHSLSLTHYCGVAPPRPRLCRNLPVWVVLGDKTWVQTSVVPDLGELARTRWGYGVARGHKLTPLGENPTSVGTDSPVETWGFCRFFSPTCGFAWLFQCKSISHLTNNRRKPWGRNPRTCRTLPPSSLFSIGNSTESSGPLHLPRASSKGWPGFICSAHKR